MLDVFTPSPEKVSKKSPTVEKLTPVKVLCEMKFSDSANSKWHIGTEARCESCNEACQHTHANTFNLQKTSSLYRSKSLHDSRSVKAPQSEQATPRIHLKNKGKEMYLTHRAEFKPKLQDLRQALVSNVGSDNKKTTTSTVPETRDMYSTTESKSGSKGSSSQRVFKKSQPRVSPFDVTIA